MPARSRTLAAPKIARKATSAASPDFLAQVDALRSQLAALQHEPPKETLRRAIHDAWRIILAPRAGALHTTLDDLIQARWWTFGDDDTADLLTEAGWTEHARPLAGLYASLGGALAQYLRIRVRWQQGTRFGALEGSSAPILKAADAAKEKEKQEKAAADLRKKLDERYGKALEDVLKDWRWRQTALSAAMEALRDLVVALESAEEQRLAALVGPAPSAADRRDLEAMKLARIDLAHFVGPAAAGFGSLLDRWRSARTRILARA